MTAFAKLNTVRFAPIVTAKILAANNVKSGVLASMRAPMRMSFISSSNHDSGKPDEVQSILCANDTNANAPNLVWFARPRRPSAPGVGVAVQKVGRAGGHCLWTRTVRLGPIRECGRNLRLWRRQHIAGSGRARGRRCFHRTRPALRRQSDL